jgi:hypothetical protein
LGKPLPIFSPHFCRCMKLLLHSIRHSNRIVRRKRETSSYQLSYICSFLTGFMAPVFSYRERNKFPILFLCVCVCVYKESHVHLFRCDPSAQAESPCSWTDFYFNSFFFSTCIASTTTTSFCCRRYYQRNLLLLPLSVMEMNHTFNCIIFHLTRRVDRRRVVIPHPSTITHTFDYFLLS